MRKLLSASFLSLALLSCAPSSDEANAKSDPVKTVENVEKVEQKSADPALWVVRDDDTVVYLFGTVHVLKPDMEWQTEKFKNAFNKADVIYQEADLSPEIQQAVGAVLPGLAFYSDGRTLRDVLDDADEKEVKEAADIVGLDMLAVDRMKPWFAAIGLTQMQMVKAGYQADKGVEMVITEQAKLEDKPLRFLETAEWQLRMMAGLPEESQVEFLVAGAEAIEDSPEMLDELVEDWFTGDVDGIADLMSDEDAMGDEIVYDAMLTKRNRNWTREIQKLMDAEEGTFLFAVGAAHLAGEDSVINMLRDQGETVVRQ
ncbi:MAG: TraB/GumN family protein [Hyphomonadaceae bacterium]|nr:TraB/GumN family protein [Hyphomonadaceae bacterium]